ncbi:hypothetical protein [Methylobacterium indicum]|uniref:hypothetical protein n=1 Tax=Methylobacterium indicum TaxID=1775910 RepID=UPI000AF8F742|nr:hypothetical protein [Methylobacterium indicum]
MTLPYPASPARLTAAALAVLTTAFAPRALAVPAVQGSPHRPLGHAASRQAAPALRSGDGSETYRGYRIEMGRDVPNAEIAALQRAAEHQVDLVEATVLDRRTKAFLRRVPVVVETGSGAGSHYDGGDRVTIAVADPNDVRPILLHEYMHVYHLRILPGGVTNPDILAFYGRARAGGFYPAGSYVLANPKEFFAMTASVYLHGRLAREPFTREELGRTQPLYYRYLTRLFGPVGA